MAEIDQCKLSESNQSVAKCPHWLSNSLCMKHGYIKPVKEDVDSAGNRLGTFSYTRCIYAKIQQVNDKGEPIG